MRKRRRLRVVRAFSTALAAGTMTSLSACADLARAVSAGDAGVNVESPLAPLALEASHGRFAYPSFARVPPAPTDVPPPQVFKAAVRAQTAEGERLSAWTAADPQMVFETQSFIDHSRRTGLQPGAAPPTDETAAAEAFAARLRAAGAAPPPVK